MRQRAYLQKVRNTRRLVGAAVMFAMLGFPGTAFASSSGGGGLPWESPLQTVVTSITGPVAFAISVIGIVATGAQLIWGGEVSGFARSLIYVVLVIAIIVLATNLLSTLFGVGALI
jgi:type IV secretory pathway VirB2 component (pilin)